MQISDSIDRISVGSPGTAGPPNIYMVRGSERAAFIDTGYGTQNEISECVDVWKQRSNIPIAAIILTHRHTDHIGGANQLRSLVKAETVCSKHELEPIRYENVAVDKTVEDGETLSLGGATLRFITTPGHTMGSLCILLEESGSLFTGDTVLGTGSVAISPDHGDLSKYLESLERLIDIKPLSIAPGHGPMIDKPNTKLKWLISHREKRETQILSMLSEGVSKIDEFFKNIYPSLKEDLHQSAKNQIKCHLIKLAKEGKVVSANPENGEYKLWRTK